MQRKLHIDDAQVSIDMRYEERLKVLLAVQPLLHRGNHYTTWRSTVLLSMQCCLYVATGVSCTPH